MTSLQKRTAAVLMSAIFGIMWAYLAYSLVCFWWTGEPVSTLVALSLSALAFGRACRFFDGGMTMWGALK